MPTIQWESIISFENFGTEIKHDGKTLQELIENVLDTNESTVEFQFMLERIQSGAGQVTIKSVQGAMAYIPGSKTLEWDQQQLETSKWKAVDGSYQTSSIERVLIHELFHAADMHHNSAWDNQHITNRERLKLETNTVHFTNEYMDKYYSEVKRDGYSPFNKYGELPDFQYHGSMDVNSSYVFKSHYYSNNMMNILYDNSEPWYQQLIDFFHDDEEDDQSGVSAGDESEGLFMFLENFEPDQTSYHVIVGDETGEIIDSLTTGNSNNLVFAGEGNDKIISNGSVNIIDGREGDDTVSYENSSIGVDVDLIVGNMQVGVRIDQLESIENVIGSNLDDTLVGDSNRNLLFGEDGNDSIDGDEGDDELRGNSGDDTLIGGLGSDILIGGTGDDTLDGGIDLDWISYTDSTALVPDTVNGGESVEGYGVDVTILSQDTVNGGFGGTVDETIDGASTDTFTGIEGIELTLADDHIRLNHSITNGQILSLDLMGGDDTLHGTNNNETIDGANFFITYADGYEFRVSGEDGNDSIGNFANAVYLDGGDGLDILTGSQMSDVLYGGANDGSRDTLEGGAGMDTYIFDSSSGLDFVNDSDGRGVLIYQNSQGSSVYIAGNADTFSGGGANDYVFTYAGGTAKINWTGDPTVQGSTGTLMIDYDDTGIDDIEIANWSNGDYGITIEGAEPGNGGGGGPGYVFTSPPSVYDSNWEEDTHNSSAGDQNYLDFVGEDVSIPEYFPIDVIGLLDGNSDMVIEPVYFTNGPQNFKIGFISPGASGPLGTEVPFSGSGSFGDPHLVTFDGLLYDFQDAGEFTLVESTDSTHPFIVQARQESWDMPGASLDDKFSANSAVATKLGNTKVGFYIPGSLPYDPADYGMDHDPATNVIPVLYIGDSPYLLPDTAVAFVEDGMIYRNGDQYTVINDYGDGMHVTVHDTHIDASIFTSNARTSGTVQGLLGNDDDDTTNEFTLDDGTNLGNTITADLLYDTFGEEWRITQAESLFLYGTGQDTSSFDNANFANTVTDLADFTTAEVNTAIADAIAAGFDQNSDIFDAIVLDILTIGSAEYTTMLAGFESLDLEVLAISDVPTNSILGTINDDAIYGTVDEDHIMALAGDDTVYAKTGDDTIIGGAGNDTLYGEGGSDTYIHNKGDGSDYIQSLNGDLSKVWMNGVSAEDLYLDVDGYNLIVTDTTNGESLQLTNQYYQTLYGYKYGSLNGVDITSSLHVQGTSATAGEIIYGSIHHGDTLEGGLGDDTLYSNGGTDFFVHNAGDGNDQFNADFNSLSTITMTGVNNEDIRLEVDNVHVKIINTTNGETITLMNQLYLVHYGYRFDNVNGINLKDGLILDGTDAGESINGTAFADTLEGGLGDDTINGKGEADLFIHNAGDGNDLFIANNGDLANIIVNGIDADDLRFNVSGYNLQISNIINSDVITLQNQYYQTNYGYKFASVNGIDLTTGLTVEGGDQGDVLNGTDNADSILGGAGSDTIHGGLGDDTLVGGLDNDTVYGEGGTDVFVHNSGDGNDQLHENPGALAIVTMNGVSNNDIYFTVDGYHLYATDTTNGEQLTLNNQYYQTNYGYKFGTLNGMDITGGLTIQGTSATLGEHMKGTDQADTLDGGLGDDTIEGKGGADLFVHDVGDGSDTLYSWNGALATVQMNGVASNDLRFNVNNNNLIVIDDATGEQLTLINQFYQTNYGYKFSTVNGIDVTGGLAIDGTDSAEVLFATDNADTINGGLGNDTLYGQGGADSFIHDSGDGNDVLYADNGSLASVTLNGVNNDDLLFSASGNHLIITDTATGETVQLTNQYYQTGYGYKFSTVNGIDVASYLNTSGTDNDDSITGTNYDDTISGGLGADTLQGNNGDDTINGDAGNDNINGGNDNDVLNGGAGNDTINGGFGLDTITGGEGDDQLTGYAYNDTFVFTASNTGDDTITDFAAGYDTLQFASTIFATANDVVTAFSSGVIDLGGGNSVTLTGISTLNAADVEII